MQDKIVLAYKYENPRSWSEMIKMEIPLLESDEYTQIVKTLTALKILLVRMGYDFNTITKAFNNVTSQLVDPDTTFNDFKN